MFPSILCAMVHSGAATSKLEILRVKYGADMAMVNYDGRTPLHVAAAEGKLKLLPFLANQRMKNQNKYSKANLIG